MRKLLRQPLKTPGFAFSRPLVLLHSDDWGRVGVCDRGGYDKLRSKGLRLGEHPWDLYSLETAEDVNRLCSLLSEHRDSDGRPPSLAMHFCVANLHFKKMREQAFETLEFLPLAEGLPGRWSRPGLIDAYRAGIAKGVFAPALEGMTYFSKGAVELAMSKKGERARLLRLLWEEDTPCIHWRMPWVGYEFWSPEASGDGFAEEGKQKVLITRACELFSALFGVPATSASAPGYQCDLATYHAWSKCGIRVVAHSPSEGLNQPKMDARGILHLYRVLEIEPIRKDIEVEKYLHLANACFTRGLPLVLSIHSINFHSSLKDFRTATLVALDTLLTALESKYKNLQYVNNDDLYAMVARNS